MAQTTTLMTAASHERLTAELDRLRTVERPAAMTALEEARTDSVNVGESGTHLSAITHKEQLDARINELEARLADAEVVTEVDTNCVSVGTIVRLDYGGNDIEELLVDEVGAPDIDSVSPSSPLGRALLGACVEDTVTWDAPAGALTATVLDIRAF